MDKAERKDTAQHALVYVGIAVTVVIVLVLLWYAIDVVLLAFVGVLLAILLRAPADWLSERFGIREGWSLAIVGIVLLALLVTAAALFGRGIVAQSVQLIDRIPEIVETAGSASPKASSAAACLRSPTRAAHSPAAMVSSSAAGSA